MQINQQSRSYKTPSIIFNFCVFKYI